MSQPARRIRNVMTAAALIIIAGVATYMIKSAAQEKRRHLDRLNAEITAEQERIAVLEADWQYLTRPDRIRRLSGDMLSLTPAPARNIITLDHLGKPDDRRETPAEGNHPPPAIGLYRITTR